MDFPPPPPPLPLPMVKFGAQIEVQIVPAWRESYVSYTRLKRTIGEFPAAVCLVTTFSTTVCHEFRWTMWKLLLLGHCCDTLTNSAALCS